MGFAFDLSANVAMARKLNPSLKRVTNVERPDRIVKLSHRRMCERRDRCLSRLLLVLSGLAIAGQGVIPAEMTNGVADITSPYTRGHFISSLISGAAWAIGALLLLGPMKRSPEWHDWYIVTIVLVSLTLVASFALRGVLPDGLAQRVGNASFLILMSSCMWFVLMSLKLMQLRGNGSGTVRVGGAGAA